MGAITGFYSAGIDGLILWSRVTTTWRSVKFIFQWRSVFHRTCTVLGNDAFFWKDALPVPIFVLFLSKVCKLLPQLLWVCVLIEAQYSPSNLSHHNKGLHWHLKFILIILNLFVVMISVCALRWCTIANFNLIIDQEISSQKLTK